MFGYAITNFVITKYMENLKDYNFKKLHYCVCSAYPGSIRDGCVPGSFTVRTHSHCWLYPNEQFMQFLRTSYFSQRP